MANNAKHGNETLGFSPKNVKKNTQHQVERFCIKPKCIEHIMRKIYKTNSDRKTFLS